jgi:hypothetical protein
MPVEDAADERGDEQDLSLGAGDGLCEGKKRCEVAVDTFLFARLGSLDQDAVAGNAFLLVIGDELRAFATVPTVSKDRRASTSVENRPGTIFRISSPKRIRIRSRTSSVRAWPERPLLLCSAMA